MDCPYHPPIDWRYSPSGPAPPSPFVVSTVQEYFGGRPTPPSSPLKVRTTIDDYAPCPPTPYCVPSDTGDVKLELSPSPDLTISPSTSSETETHDDRSDLEVDDPTSFMPLADDTFDTPETYWGCCPSDCLLYAYEPYAYPSPVLAMMQRASLDMCGLETQPLNVFDCGRPLKLFTLSGGRVPRTGLDICDQQSLEYYRKSPLRGSKCFPSYLYTIRSIIAVQQALYTKWTSVYPTPIPPVIIRSRDLIGRRRLQRRLSGFACVVPTEDSIWDTVCRRGIDWDHRPIDPSLRVELEFVKMGAAIYYPQHIVASRFAVNIFLEVADSATGPVPLCEYLGAYVLQTVGPTMISYADWMNVDFKTQLEVFHRAPDSFRTHRHFFNWPRLPYIQFCYYKWDKNILGLADEISYS